MDNLYAEYVIDEYIFKSKSDYMRALKEKETIEKLQIDLESENYNEMLQLYNKMISKNYFITPVGIDFLRKLRQRLISFFGEENIPKIPIARAKVNKQKNVVPIEQYEKLENQLEKEKSIKFKLIVFLTAMFLMVFGMLYIAITNENVGYFRTEDKVLNKYSAWEEDLKAREKAIKEKEEELGIEINE